MYIHIIFVAAFIAETQHKIFKMQYECFKFPVFRTLLVSHIPSKMPYCHLILNYDYLILFCVIYVAMSVCLAVEHFTVWCGYTQKVMKF